MSGDDGLLVRILTAFEAEEGPMTTRALARKLDVNVGVLKAMLDELVRKGKLREVRSETCNLCPAAGTCPLATVEAPVRYVLAESDIPCPPDVAADA